MLCNIVKRKYFVLNHHLEKEEVIQYIQNGVKILNYIHLPLSRQILFIIIFIIDAKLKGIVITTLAAYPKYRD